MRCFSNNNNNRCTQVQAANTQAARTGNGCRTDAPPRLVKALINTVIDSCCKFEEVQKDVIVPITKGCDICNLKLGRQLDIEVDGDVTSTEVNREELNGRCLSTVLNRYPIRFLDPCASPCDCEPNYISQTFTSLHTVGLICTPYSVLDTQNSRILVLSAIITHVDCDYVVVSVVVGARICLRQTAMQEHCLCVLPATTPTCEEKVRADADCDNCDGTNTESAVQVRVPNVGSSGFFV